MVCILTSSFRVLWNGEKTEGFSPSSGLRQGDPLSPYLFVLCLECLGHMITDLVEEGHWKPVSLTREGPKLTHLCFADDIILLAKADIKHAILVQDCLSKFCNVSGQRVSLQKSSLVVSKNVSPYFAKVLNLHLGIPLKEHMGKYLGAPSIQKSVTKGMYNEVPERFQHKLQGWKSKCLSMAGRVTMIKAVTSAIPTHIMQTTALPKGICDKMDRCQRQFLWGSSTEKRRIHKVGWTKICKPKNQGGLGIRKMNEFNKALLSKLAWRVVSKDDNLSMTVLRNKYCRGKNGLQALCPKNQASCPKNQASHTWRSIYY